jgi:uncharacterized protein YndB with AHSA1/START domain
LQEEKDAALHVEEIYKGYDHLKLVANFPNKSPDQLFQFWIDPSLIPRWWGPQIVEIEPKLGGKYTLGWPKRSWFLRGEYTQFQKGKLLDFTWKWDHEPLEPVRIVRVDFEPKD